uniref:PHD finger protein 2 n=1 Tax=Aegilops tauschii TaxID=37682 RepID=M8CKM5_AEGTA
MAKTKQGKRDIDSYTIRGTTKVVRVGDCVLMRPSDTDNAPYVARVESLESDGRGSVRVRSAHTIEGKCIVHSFKNYTKLDNVGPEDFFCRFEYKAATGAFTPDRVAVYCKCEMPYNPDDLMVQCEGCKDCMCIVLLLGCLRNSCLESIELALIWFHPTCMGMTIEQAKKLDTFLCADCAKENGAKRPSNSYPSSPSSDSKVEPKRRKR